MNHNELLKLVRATSIDLMNQGIGDGTIYACYGDRSASCCQSSQDG
jgi:hypothetical protein